MSADDVLDRRLKAALGEPAATALTEWGREVHLSFRFCKEFTNGRSSALVLAVYERGRGRARKLILKLAPPGGPATAGEYRRHSDATHEVATFADAHLAPLVHTPIRVGDGSWILFQSIAGADLEAYSVLTALLAGVPRAAVLAQQEQEPVKCDRDTFAQVCAHVVGSMLGEFAIAPQVDLWPATEYLNHHFGERIGAGKRLRELADDWPGPTIELPGEPPLPNPFAFVFEPPRSLAAEIPVLLGRAHGDLHTENILVRTDSRIDGTDFFLVDLARYSDRAPLTGDQTQLVLSIVNRAMGELSGVQRDVLIELLATGNNDDGGMLPTWLTALLRRQHETVTAWLRTFSLIEEWRRLVPLSTLAGALIFAARASTPAAHREWFLRLAARCADAFGTGADRRTRAGVPPGPPGASGRDAATTTAPARTAVPEVRTAVDDGRRRLCESLPTLRPQAVRRGHGDRLTALVARARLGHDIRADIAALERVVYGRDEGSRMLPALGVLEPGPEEVYRCPLTVACGRMTVREPSAARPSCAVLGDDMEPVG